jgi:CMP-2-keto-3-deoxyoctulosonic acid synthetase
MEVEQIMETIKNSPQSWKIVCQNRESIVFGWGEYRFTRLSDRFNCVMILNSKQDRINVNWQADDPVISQLYLGLVAQHLQGFTRAKSAV